MPLSQYVGAAIPGLLNKAAIAYVAANTDEEKEETIHYAMVALADKEPQWSEALRGGVNAIFKVPSSPRFWDGCVDGVATVDEDMPDKYKPDERDDHAGPKHAPVGGGQQAPQKTLTQASLESMAETSRQLAGAVGMMAEALKQSNAPLPPSAQAEAAEAHRVALLAWAQQKDKDDAFEALFPKLFDPPAAYKIDAVDSLLFGSYLITPIEDAMMKDEGKQLVAAYGAAVAAANGGQVDERLLVKGLGRAIYRVLKTEHQRGGGK